MDCTILICQGFLWGYIFFPAFIQGKCRRKHTSVLRPTPGNIHQWAPEQPQVCLSSELLSQKCVNISWDCSNKQCQIENKEVGEMRKQQQQRIQVSIHNSWCQEKCISKEQKTIVVFNISSWHQENLMLPSCKDQGYFSNLARKLWGFCSIFPLSSHLFQILMYIFSTILSLKLIGSISISNLQPHSRPLGPRHGGML